LVAHIWFVADGLGHAMTNQPLKFEVPSFTSYRNMKDVAKCRKWDGSEWLGSPVVTENSVI